MSVFLLFKKELSCFSHHLYSINVRAPNTYITKNQYLQANKNHHFTFYILFFLEVKENNTLCEGQAYIP